MTDLLDKFAELLDEYERCRDNHTYPEGWNAATAVCDFLIEHDATVTFPQPPSEAAATFDPHKNYVKVKGGWERRKPDDGSDAT